MFLMQKRAREEDEEDESRHTCDDHKKPRTLAFRTSPTTKHDQLSSLTSHHSRPRSHSASNMAQPESSENAYGLKHPPPSPNDPHDNNDDDMDMVDAHPSVSPPRREGLDMTAATPPRPGTINVSWETPPRESQEAAHAGRVPTPRYGHFRSKDIRMDLGDAVDNDSLDGPISSKLERHHRALLRYRRLPSPIGEDFSMMSSSAVTEVPLESLNRPNLQGRDATLLERTGIQTDSTWSNRSRTSTPGKTMLHMGFRADCEKCRARVPGHYNHVIRT